MSREGTKVFECVYPNREGHWNMHLLFENSCKDQKGREGGRENDDCSKAEDKLLYQMPNHLFG